MSILKRDNLIWLLYVVFAFLFKASFNNSMFAWICFVPLIFVVLYESSLKNVVLRSLSVSLICFFVINKWMFGLFYVTSASVEKAFFVRFLYSLYLSLYVILFCVVIYVSRKFYKKIWYPFFLAALWVSFEFLRTKLSISIPVWILGYSQYQKLNIIQIADFLSVYGVSFLLIFCSAAVSVFVFHIIKQKKLLLVHIVSFLVLFSISLLYSHSILDANQYYYDYYYTTLLQPEISKQVQLDNEYKEIVLKKYKSLFERLSVDNSRKHLVVWPYITFPYNTQDKDVENFVSSVADSKDVSHLIEYENKNHKLNKFDDKKFGLSINSEILVPHFIRRQTKTGSSFLVSVADESIYSDLMLHKYFLAAGIFRAIENRRFVIRSSNKGYSYLVDNRGSMFFSFNRYDIKRGIFKPLSENTFYIKFGDVFAYLCFIGTLVVLFAKLYKKT